MSILGRILREKSTGWQSLRVYQVLTHTRHYSIENCISNKRIGIVGVGMVGNAVINNLQKQNFKVTSIYDIERSKCEEFTDCHIEDSPRAVAEQSDVIISALPMPPHVKQAFEGDNGLLKGM